MSAAPVAHQADTRASGAATGAEQVVAGLKALITDAIPTARDIEFTGLTRAAGGLSRENWSLDATWVDATGPHSHHLMLMRDAAGTLLATVRAREFALLKALEGTGVPAPKAHWVDPDGRRLGSPTIVMDRVPGTCDYMVVNGERPLAARLDLARAFIDLMARIHAVDWRGRGLGEVLGSRPTRLRGSSSRTGRQSTAGCSSNRIPSSTTCSPGCTELRRRPRRSSWCTAISSRATRSSQATQSAPSSIGRPRIWATRWRISAG